MMKQIVPFHIYYINMDRSVNRNKCFLDSIKNISFLSVTRVSATDGSIMKNESEFDSMYKRRFGSRNLSRAEKGCTLSHINALKLINQNESIKDSEWVLVAEDDVEFINDPILSFENIYKNIPKDCRILQFYQCNHQKVYELYTKYKKKINYLHAKQNLVGI